MKAYIQYNSNMTFSERQNKLEIVKKTSVTCRDLGEKGKNE